MTRFRKTTGIGYAAYSSERLTPIVITITSTTNLCSYQMRGPDKLAHGSKWQIETEGSCSLCQAAIKALRSLTPGRTWHLRAEMAALRAQATECGDFQEDANPPRLPITIETSNSTFAQMGTSLTANLNAGVKSPRLLPSLRVLRKQLQRFEVTWNLIPVESSEMESLLNWGATEANRVALGSVQDSEEAVHMITSQQAHEHECGLVCDIQAAADEFSFEKLLSANEAAELLRIHVNTLRLWAREGKLPSRRIGRRLTFRASTLNQWLEASCYAGNAVLTASTERKAA
jgi:excisionase family DNA binding protein